MGGGNKILLEKNGSDESDEDRWMDEDKEFNHSEDGKQFCGICLSEEGIARGVLNCCDDYFCFGCIMEWSKMESRCPLCKQRFLTISRTGGGDDLRDEVFPVPERDQFYLPDHLDPFENAREERERERERRRRRGGQDVLRNLYRHGNHCCTVCEQSVDCAPMFGCAQCHRPTHTYCVSLGHRVPNESWFCNGCRPPCLSSLNPTPDHGTSNDWSDGSEPSEKVRTYMTYVRDEDDDLVWFLDHFRSLWKEARPHGVTHYDGIKRLIDLLPGNWQRWAREISSEFIFPVGKKNDLVGDFPKFSLCVYKTLMLFDGVDGPEPEPEPDRLPRRGANDHEAGPSRPTKLEV